MNDTIVMIHGMWAGGWYWENYQTFFTSKGYRCLTPTLRHHDVKPEDPPPPGLAMISVRDYTDDLLEFVQNLDDIPILMGHSMGGLLAQIIATQIDCKALVLIAPAATDDIPSLSFSVVKTFWSSFARWGFWKKPMRPTFKEIAYGIFQLLPFKEQKRMYDQFVFESGKAATEIGFPMFDKNRTSHVDETRISCPVLICAGAQDRIIPLSAAKKMYEKYSHVATLKVYEDHAHWLLGETGWETVAQDIDSWLQNI